MALVLCSSCGIHTSDSLERCSACGAALGGGVGATLARAVELGRSAASSATTVRPPHPAETLDQQVFRAFTRGKAARTSRESSPLRLLEETIAELTRQKKPGA
jgi:hypothetical protein